MRWRCDGAGADRVASRRLGRVFLSEPRRVMEVMMSRMKCRVRLVRVGGRLRAVMSCGDRRYEWWAESVGHGRHNPFKPIPVGAMEIMGRLPTPVLQRIHEFLWMAGEGDEITFEV